MVDQDKCYLFIIKMKYICEICGQPYGSCDLSVHRTTMGKNYDFDMNDVIVVDLPTARSSVLPRLTAPYKKRGKLFVKLPATIYKKLESL